MPGEGILPGKEPKKHVRLISETRTCFPEKTYVFLTDLSNLITRKRK